MSKAVYPGSFDPITFGHIDIAKRALKVFDSLIILISDNPNKVGLFTAIERKELVEEALKDHKDRIRVVISHDLTVNATYELGASHIIRGLRAVTDFEYEFQLTHANRVLNKKVDSIFFMTDNKYSFLSSTTVKEIALFEGDLKQFVPAFIEDKIMEKVRKMKNS
jgi:pantetheine-phosphate adenylyltransferase